MEKNIIAVHGICNTLSLVITDIIYDINEKATTVFITSENKRLHKYTSLVHYDNNGDPYIKRFNCKYYLKDFLRC